MFILLLAFYMLITNLVTCQRTVMFTDQLARSHGLYSQCCVAL